MRPTEIPAGEHAALSWRDFGIENKSYPVLPTGVVRARNTKHGARIVVEVAIPSDRHPAGIVRDFFVNLKSRSYVVLCQRQGDDLTKWRAGFDVRVVRDPRDGRRRVEVV